MGFTLTGTTITQSGTDAAGLGANIDAFTSVVEVYEGMIRNIQNGGVFEATGDFTDETGSFALMLTDNSKFGSNGGNIIIGKREEINGKPLYSKGGLIIVKNDGSDSSGYINYANENNTGLSTTGTISFYDCDIIHYTSTANDRSHAFVTNLAGSSFRVINQNSSPGNFLNLRFQTGARVDDNIIQNVQQFEFHGDPISFSRNKFIDTQGFIAFSNGTLIKLNNIDFITDNFSDVGITNDGGLYYIDTFQNGSPMLESVINAAPTGSFANLGIMVNSDPTLHGVHWGKSQTETMRLPDGSTIDDKVYYRDNFGNEFLPTVIDGFYSETIRLKRATSTGFNVPTYSNYYPIVKGIIGYTTNIEATLYADYDSFESLGLTGESTRLRTEDTLITEQDKTLVDAYTTFDVPKFYDRAKSYLVDNYAGETEVLVTISGDFLDLKGKNLNVLEKQKY